MLFKRIVIKIGTNVLTDEAGRLQVGRMAHISSQVSDLIRAGGEVLLVSSGAVAAGREALPGQEQAHRVLARQMLSAVGQARMMQLYQEHFGKEGLPVAQVLATKEDFRDRRHYLNMKNCLLGLIRGDVVPILNENDVVAVTELMFTDNDELAGLVAAMVNAQALFILSSVEGLYDGPPGSEGSSLLKEVNPFDAALDSHILPARSSFGRGGMHTKLRVARKAAKLGITTLLANGKANGVIAQLAEGGNPGTRFMPQRSTSNVKKWLAHQESGKGRIYLNEGAARALRDPEQVSSLLPVGIVRVEGEFEKGDIVHLFQDELPIGIGMAQYGSARARKCVGKRGQKPLVHYDYLFVNP